MLCVKCGHALDVHDQFCRDCGTRVPGPPADFVAPETVVKPVYCPACGSFREDPHQYCRTCGSPPVGTQGQRLTEGAGVGSGGRSTTFKRNIIIAAAVAIVLLAGGVTAFALLSSSSPDDKSSASVADQAAALETPVADAQRDFVSTASTMSTGAGGLSQLHDAAKVFVAATDLARSKANALPSTSSDDGKLVAALRRLLSAQSNMADEFVNGPTTLPELSTHFVNSAVTMSEAVNTAAAALGRYAPGAEPANIPATAWERLRAIVSRQQRRDEMRTFLGTVEGLLNQSASGRSQLASTLAQVENHCAIAPDEAAQRFRAVADNRQGLISQANALHVPDNAQARDIVNTFQRAMQHSVAADNAFADWMSYLFDYYYRYPVGCPGAVPRNDDHRRASSESVEATAAKQRLVAVYNPLARRAKLRSNWSASSI